MMRMSQTAVRQEEPRITRVVVWSGLFAMFVFTLVLDVPRALAEEGQRAQQEHGSQMEQGYSSEMSREGSAMQGGMGTGMSGTHQAGVKADDLDDRHVVNASGDTIGEVDEIVRSKDDNSLSAVVEVGGFLGIGEKEVTIPLSELRVHGDKLVAPETASTEEQLESRSEYDESRYEEVSESEQIDRSEFAAFEGTEDSGERGSTRHTSEGTGDHGSGD